MVDKFKFLKTLDGRNNAKVFFLNNFNLTKNSKYLLFQDNRHFSQIKIKLFGLF